MTDGPLIVQSDKTLLLVMKLLVDLIALLWKQVQQWRYMSEQKKLLSNWACLRWAMHLLVEQVMATLQPLQVLRFLMALVQLAMELTQRMNG
jgi:hypothetical protein